MSELNSYVCGMTWGWTGIRGTWATNEAEQSMQRMNDVKTNWVTIAFSALQDDPQALKIKYKDEPTVTDDEIRWAVGYAKKLGLNVCLKPIVNCRNGTWRAHINFFDQDVPGEPSWREWFLSYNEFIGHYADLAEELECEMYCVGCEMVQMNKHEEAWRELIQIVRQKYNGWVTYNCDKYQEDRIAWWDAVDIISSSGYYPIDSWEKQLDRIEQVVSKHNKPFFFMEAGCPSRTGSSAKPNDWSLKGDPNEAEQAEYYKVMFKHCSARNWFSGYMFWDWPARLYQPEQAKENDDYCIYAKAAENIVREHYQSILSSY